MARIKFGGTVKVRGSGPAEDFSATITTQLREVPIKRFSRVMLPSCTVAGYTPQFNAVDLVPEMTGDIKGAYVRVDDPDNLEVVGLSVRKRTNSYMNGEPITVHVGNRFNERTYQSSNTSVAVLQTALADTGTHDTNSLAGRSKQLVEQVYAGRTPSPSSLDLFLDGGQYNPSAPGGPNLTHNPNRVAPTFDLSGVSIHRTGATDAGLPVELISPRHFVAATHTNVSVGHVVTFRRRDGTYQSATVVGTYKLMPEQFDFQVGILSDDITDCATYPTLPGDWARYLPANTKAVANANNGLYGMFPVLVRAVNPGNPGGTALEGNLILNTNSPHLIVGWAGVCNADAPEPGAAGVTRMDYPLPPVSSRNGTLFEMYRTLYAGDSGSPHFMPVPLGSASGSGFTPALISVTFGVFTGAFLPDHIAWINEKMAALSTEQSDPRVFTIKTVDLSKFPTYS